MKFYEVTEKFEELESVASRNAMTQILASLLKQASPDEAATISYMTLGSLQPQYVAAQFNFAAKSMADVVARLVNMTRAAVEQEAKQCGDLGVVLVQHWDNSLSRHLLTLLDIRSLLLQFLAITGTGSQEIKEQFLFDLLSMLDPISAKYVIRIILGKLRLGFSDMTLLDAFSWMETGDKSLRPDLENGYNISADIGLIIKTLKEEGIAGIRKMSIIPGIPIRPAAAERLEDAQAIYKKLGDCVAQPKLDGFRLQVHVEKKDDDVSIRFFSRNLIDMSDMFPDLAQAVKKLDVESFIAEGEAIAYDVESGQFLPFQETVKRKRKHDIETVAQDFPLKLYFFDALFLNGSSLLAQTHEERRALLAKLLDTPSIKKDAVMLLVDEVKIKDAEHLEAYFNETVSIGLEGLVVKRPDALYQPGKRNFNWIKLKRQESGSLDDTIDCVILGYYGGHGKRAAFGIGALLVGVYNKQDDMFQTIAKIGTGLTDEEWKDLKSTCDRIQVAHKPINVQCHKDLYPDIWVQPERVCMVRADEITRSPLHQAGLTEYNLGFALRFPRFMGYRNDKSATDVTTIDEVRELFDIQFSKKQKLTSEKHQKEMQNSIKFD